MALTFASCASTGLASSHKKGFGPLSVRIPYANVENYYGYISTETQPDGNFDGKDAHYLYFWVPAVIDEVGISMCSPANSEPAEGDFSSDAFTSLYTENDEAFFDTFIALEKMAIFDENKIASGGEVLGVLATNDDSSEMRKNPAGNSYNSLLRHVSEVSDPLRALTRGVYRIAFTSYRGEVNGSFVANVGTNIPGVVIASSLEELEKAVTADSDAS